MGNDLDVPTLANMLKFGGLTLWLFVWLRTEFEDVNITGQGLQLSSAAVPAGRLITLYEIGMKICTPPTLRVSGGALGKYSPEEQ